MADLFVSFTTADLPAAERVVGAATELGLGQVFLDRNPRSGIQLGEDWERALIREIRAARAMVVLWSAAYAKSQWCFLEHTLARSLGKPILPIRLDDSDLPDVLARHQVASVAAGWTDVLERLGRRLVSLGIPRGRTFPFDPRAHAPYPGLAAYDVDQAAVFFGREVDVQAILDRLRMMHRHGDEHWLVVVGASGSGKSSIVRAGVLAHLRNQPDWLPSAVVEPHPGRVLEVAHAAIAAASPSRPAVIIVDQLEQWLSADRTEECRRDEAALDALIADRRGLVLAAVRSDHYDLLQRHPAFRAKPMATVSIGPLPKSQLRAVIEEPARIAGLEIDEALVDELLDGIDGDALPLLAFALHELWRAGPRTCSTSPRSARTSEASPRRWRGGPTRSSDRSGWIRPIAS